MTPLVAKFADLRWCEATMGQLDVDEVTDGFLADALDRIAPTLSRMRNRI